MIQISTKIVYCNILLSIVCQIDEVCLTWTFCSSITLNIFWHDNSPNMIKYKSDVWFSIKWNNSKQSCIFHCRQSSFSSMIFCEAEYFFLTKRKSQFLFLGWRIFLSCTSHTRQEKKHTHFPRKNLFIALHHGSDFILINKIMILLHKYF